MHDPDLDNELRVRRTRSENWGHFRSWCESKLALLEGDVVPQLRTYVQARVHPELWRAIFDTNYEWPRHLNPFADVITRVGVVYHRPARRALVREIDPTRETPPTAEEQESFEDPVYAQAMADARVDGVMDRALKIAMATGGCLVWPYIEDGTLRLRTISPDCFTPIVGYTDTSRLMGVRYHIYASQDATREAAREFLWDLTGLVIAKDALKIPVPPSPTPEQRAQFAADYGGMVELGEGGKILSQRTGPDYPYRDADNRPMLPFSTLKIGYVPDDQFLPTNEGDDLWGATMRVGFLDIQMAWLLRHGSHKQLAITGTKAEAVGHQNLDPMMPIVLPGDKDEVTIQLLDMKSDPSVYEAAKTSVMRDVLVRRGWSYDDFVSSAERQTAEARILSQRDRNRYLAHLQSRCSDAEVELGRAVVAVWNAEAAGMPLMSVLSKPTCDFADMDGMDVALNWDRYAPLVEANVMNLAEVILDEDPDLGTEEAAIQQGIHNAKVNRLMRGYGIAAAAVAATIPAPNQSTVPAGDEDEDLNGDEEDEPGPGRIG